jgi:hypothetical protein
MANISKKRICADEAFAAYMALGPSRSLSRLLESYRAQTDIVPPSISTLKLWSARDAWQARARDHDIQVQGEASKRTIERQAEQRVEISIVLEDTYRDTLGRMREQIAELPQVKTPSQIVELVSAAGLLHGQLMEIQRGKMPDQGLLEKLVQQMAGAAGNGVAPGDEELERLIELAMAEPDKPPN